MRWAIMTKEEKLDYQINKYCFWHAWFAWYPVKVLHPTTGVTYRVWLERVGRRLEVHTSHADYQRSDYVGHPHYCFFEDMLVNRMREDYIIDKRDRR